MAKIFYARGKILLTSEFLILHGAKALALPLKVGQILELTPKEEPGVLHWKAEFNDSAWFESKIVLDDLTIIQSSDLKVSKHLIFILKQLMEIQPEFNRELAASDVLCTLEFDPNYGFGSSSTLTSLLAQWAGVDAMQFHFHISKGSGYDVACANAESAILYEVIDEMPVVQAVDFQPAFMEQLWLVYLGQKQETSASVASFLNNYSARSEDVEYFSGLTYSFLKAGTFQEFCKLISEHEGRLSTLLKIPTLKESRFTDLEGEIKSLGAWGGDFALLASPWSKEQLTEYLLQKGIHHWFSFKELVL